MRTQKGIKKRFQIYIYELKVWVVGTVWKAYDSSTRTHTDFWRHKKGIKQVLRTAERAARIHANTVRTCENGLRHMKDLSTTIWTLIRASRYKLKPKRDVTAYSKALKKAYSSSEDLNKGPHNDIWHDIRGIQIRDLNKRGFQQNFDTRRNQIRNHNTQGFRRISTCK